MTNKLVSKVTQKDNFKLRKARLNTAEAFVSYEEYPALVNFPPLGQSDRLYMAEATNTLYRWTGAAYVSVSGGGGGSSNSYTPSGW